MRIEELEVAEQGDDVTRSVSLSWVGDSKRLWVRVPADCAAPADDLTPFLPPALLLAMRRSEPLQIDGAVCPRLLHRLPQLQDTLSLWDPTLTCVPVRATETLAAPTERPAGRGVGFSRGVDSTFSAAWPRPEAERLTHLVYSEGFETVFGSETERAQQRVAAQVAELLGLQLAVVATNVRELQWGVISWNDGHGAALALLGHSLSGALRGFAQASNSTYANVMPRGSHPQTDPLWSSERVELTHDLAGFGRTAKVCWLARERPELLEHLYVCWGNDSARNCGRCDKCLMTMIGLEVAGALGTCDAFPSELDLEAVARLRHPSLLVLMSWNTTWNSVPPGAEWDPLRDAIATVISESAAEAASATKTTFGLSRGAETTIRALLAGSPSPVTRRGPLQPIAEVAPLDPSWPPPRNVAPGRIGLLVGVDEAARRHVYGAGSVPPGRYAGELGGLLAERPPKGVELRFDADAQPILADRPHSRLRAARWALQPLRWRDLAGPLPRLRSSSKRGLDALRAARNGGGPDSLEPPPRAPASAWLHATGGDGRLPLFAARHPALDDVLLTTDADEPARLGYVEPQLLGYLEDCAPETGSRGIERPPLRWTRRWGLASSASRRS